VFASILPFEVLIVLNLFCYDYNNDVIFPKSPTGSRVIYYVVSLLFLTSFGILKHVFLKSIYFICNKKVYKTATECLQVISAHQTI